MNNTNLSDLQDLDLAHVTGGQRPALPSGGGGGGGGLGQNPLQHGIDKAKELSQLNPSCHDPDKVNPAGARAPLVGGGQAIVPIRPCVRVPTP